MKRVKKRSLSAPKSPVRSGVKGPSLGPSVRMAKPKVATQVSDTPLLWQLLVTRWFWRISLRTPVKHHYPMMTSRRYGLGMMQVGVWQLPESTSRTLYAVAYARALRTLTHSDMARFPKPKPRRRLSAVVTSL